MTKARWRLPHLQIGDFQFQHSWKFRLYCGWIILSVVFLLYSPHASLLFKSETTYCINKFYLNLTYDLSSFSN
ncbi:hypothetical protein O6P43_020268 [Quillaja saponaria]|uniref:Uncharacterized protein n=1 Tax=Quillaja saponaria TaxID=32244 RepID=A0AAD7LLX9_QUISA|nr:hypothetical protein O6P43_020268 [Quillaja saponaria]